MPYILNVTCPETIDPGRSSSLIYSNATDRSMGRSAIGTLALIHAAYHSPVHVPFPVDEADIRELVMLKFITAEPVGNDYRVILRRI